MKEMIRDLYGEFDYPAERRSLEKQLDFLEQEYKRFKYQINPYQLQPGLMLEVDVTSIKRKRVTLDAMSRAINEFLHGVSRTFQEAALPSGSRRVAAGGSGQSFGDLFSSVSAGSLNLSGGAAEDYPDAQPHSKAAPKKRASKPKRPSPDTDKGGIREL
jgi:hypothetical protein